MFKIINNILQTTDSPYYIGTTKTTIDIVSEIPITSKVYCVIEGPFETYSIPLIYKETNDDGNVFSSVFIIDNTNLVKQKLNKDISCYFSIIINDVIIDNKQKLTINPKLFANIDNQITELIKELNEIKQELKSYQSKLLNEPKQNIKKGMVPVATGVGDLYTWDYIFDNLTKNVTALSKLVSETSDALVKLTIRVNDMEQKLHDHIYESYYL